MKNLKTAFISIVLSAIAIPAMSQETPPKGYYSLDQLAPVVEQEAQNLFVVKRGASFRLTLDEWAKKSGWQPIAWKLPEEFDLTLGADAEFSGDFITVTERLLKAIGSDLSIRIRFNKGNKLAVVEPLR